MADKAIDVHLAEYNSLRTELLNRIEIQFNAVTWLFALIAAVTTALTFTYEKVGIHNLIWLFQTASVFLPVLISPVAFMAFDHTIMIHRLGAYIGGKLRSSIIGCLSEPDCEATVLMWDPLADAPRATITSIRFFFFLLASWFLYFLLIPVPTVFVTYMGWWWRWPFPAVLIFDWVLTLAFLYCSIAIWNERAGWLRLKKIPLPF